MNTETSHSGRITEIREQVRDPERVSLFIDGEFRTGLPRMVVAERNLQVGQILTEEDLETLESLDEVSRATHSAVRLLSFRPRSRDELQRRLRRNGFQDEAIESAIERLAELRYVNDEDFASYWVENRQQHRPRGKRLIASELRSKGVPQDVAERAIDEAEIDEYSAALDLATARNDRLRGLDRNTWRRRMSGFLQRRGYGWEVVRKVMDELEQRADER